MPERSTSSGYEPPNGNLTAIELRVLVIDTYVAVGDHDKPVAVSA